MEMDQIDRLAFRFFKLFARFEYALKAAGYVKARHGCAEADWGAFQGVTNVTLIDLRCQRGESVTYLLENPPKHQRCGENRTLFWEAAGGGEDMDSLLNHIKRVRNNLFHGGKHAGGGEWDDSPRTCLLLEHAFNVLDYIRRHDQRVRDLVGDERLD
ncbi:hypothetical protein ACPRNU_12430 [Chromobacterium vaccinii]|uniref:hypothetical protein n=1 Tax=Chromobacterium vaccinii TaxID=1108595 RepID=UPI003C787F95